MTTVHRNLSFDLLWNGKAEKNSPLVLDNLTMETDQGSDERIISPSVKFRNEKCQKQTHCRHTHYPHQPQVSQLKAASPVHSVVSAPGHLEPSRLSLEPISEDPMIINGTVSTNSEYAGYRFHPTVRFKTTSLPGMPLSRKYSPSPNGTTRSVPISYRHHMVTPSGFWAHENPKILYGRQRDRLKYEEQAKEECRRLKRTSEILKHRIDKQYYMAGSKIPLQGRYDVDNTDLLRLKLLSQNKQLAGYKAAKDMSSNPRESPSGQLSTPVPRGRRGKTGSDALSSGTQRENHSPDGKWAEEEDSEASSVNEYDTFTMEARRQEFPATNSLVVAEGKKQSVSSEELLRTAGGETSDKKTDDITSKENAPTRGAKKGKIRFQEDGKSGGKIEKGRKNLSKKNPDGPENEENTSETGEPKEEKRNKYLDEWLGIKTEVQDTRYQPGKPPPNRIFISASPENNKKTAKKFSSTFLTEITEGNTLEDENDMTPDAKYGIINDRQRHAFGLLFDEVDKDKNGSVTLEELKRRMQPSVSKHDIHHFVQVFDLNKDKTVDKREFTAICALNDRLTGVTTESEDASLALDLENLAHHIVIFKEMFKTVDEDDDNRLDAGELLEMVSAAMETEIGADLQLAKEVLERARDEFGFIDFVGFLSYISFFAKLLKTILEHPLTIDELERARERVRQQHLTFKPKKQAKEPKSWEVF